MVRKIDNGKKRKIREVLRKHPEGLWVREISRKSGLDKSTVSRYLRKYMKDEIEVLDINSLVKLVKLKDV